MTAATKNIVVYRDIDFYYAFSVQNEDSTPFDLTGYTAVAKIRSQLGSSTILLTFTCSITVPASGGPVIISATISQTSSLPLGISHWDCIITHPSAPDVKLLEGKAHVKDTASR